MTHRYHPDAPSAAIAPDTLDAFLHSPFDEDLMSIPGLGPASSMALQKVGVTCPHQLMGQFLVLRSQGMNIEDHQQAFMDWLVEIGTLPAGRLKIVKAISAKACCMGFVGERKSDEHDTVSAAAAVAAAAPAPIVAAAAPVAAQPAIVYVVVCREHTDEHKQRSYSDLESVSSEAFLTKASASRVALMYNLNKAQDHTVLGWSNLRTNFKPDAPPPQMGTWHGMADVSNVRSAELLLLAFYKSFEDEDGDIVVSSIESRAFVAKMDDVSVVREQTMLASVLPYFRGEYTSQAGHTVATIHAIRLP